MPASSHSDGRGRWKRRKRDLRPTHLQEENDAVPEEDVEEEDNNNDEIDNHRDNNSGEDAAGEFAEPSFPSSGASEVLADVVVRISEFPAVVKRTVNRPHGSVMAIMAAERADMVGDSKAHQQGALAGLENVSYGQLQAVSTEAPVVEPEKYVITPPPIMEGSGVIKRFGSRVHVLPMHSEWFSPAKVHRLERQVVPHFFSGKSPEHMPEKYMECRNHIVAKYMDNPEKRITVSDCQGLIDEISNEDLTRIVRFLDHWGIINYCAAASCHEPWNAESYLREEPNGEVHVPSAALRSIDSLIKFDKPKCRLKVADVYSSLPCRDDFSDLDSRIRECIYDNNCTSCPQPVPTSFYRSRKDVDALLCSNCFHDGRFVSGHSSIDFVRVDSTKDYEDLDGDSWTDQETLLLLEAMEIYNENWNEIAEHVGTKSKAQCILYFLRLPMEDGLLEKLEVPSMPKSMIVSNGDAQKSHSNMNGSLQGPSLQDSDSECKLLFANSGNPVMAMVSFLASAVGPRVAAACAHASLAALAEDEHKEGFRHGNRMNTENVHGGEGGFHGSIHRKENSAIQGSFGQNEAEINPLSAEKVKAAAKAGIAAAAMKAKLFADHEEREIQRLLANIINHQLKRLELKLKQFAEVETLLMKECEQVEKTRQRFAAERAHIISSRFGPAGVTSQMSLPGTSSPMVNNNINNMQQMPFMQRQPMFPMGPRMPLTAMQASTSAPPNVMFTTSGNAQPTLNHPLMRGCSFSALRRPSLPGQSVISSPLSISGYADNQPVHPQMPFMQRQPMFPMGPRMPLTAMQASTSAPPNVMFTTSGNAQPTLNHPLMRSVSGTGSGLG